MPVKLFIVGLPGSGKSAVARFICAYTQDRSKFNPDHCWLTSRYNDYPILYTMYKDDKEHKRIMRAEPDGFNVIDFSAFDEALKNLERWISRPISSKQAQPEEIMLIEFARNDYRKAFRQFSRDFLQGSFFIYLGADLEICKQRISDRVANPESEQDDYPVSDYIFEKYYHSDNGQSLSQILAQDFGINRSQILLLDNNYSLDEAKKKIAPFIDSIINPVTAPENSRESLAEESRTSILIGG